jgi:hypothetical protein
MELVRFISCEDDETDQIVSFALAYDEMEIRSLSFGDVWSEEGEWQNTAHFSLIHAFSFG